MDKILIHLNSILDFRYETRDKELSDLAYAGRFYDEQYSFDRETLLKSKETYFIRLLIVVLGNLQAEQEVKGERNDIEVVINLGGIDLLEEEREILMKGLRNKILPIVDNVSFMDRPLTIDEYKTFSYVIDYEGLEHLDMTLSKELTDDLGTAMVMTKVKDLSKVIMITPTKGDKQALLDQNFKEIEDVNKFFDNVMKDYQPLIALEYVDMTFFCKNDLDIKETKGE